MGKSKSIKPSCPGGYIIRGSYQAKSGKRVSARCIPISKPKTKLIRGNASKIISAKTELLLSKKAEVPIPMHCPKGMSLRRGYTRRSYNRKIGTHVRHALTRQVCVRTRGKALQKKQQQQVLQSPKHLSISNSNSNSVSKRIIVLDPEDHYLSQYGYHNVETKTPEMRLQSLHNLINHFISIKGEMATYNYIIRALNARYILNRNTNSKIASIFKQDQRTISKEYKKIKNKK